MLKGKLILNVICDHHFNWNVIVQVLLPEADIIKIMNKRISFKRNWANVFVGKVKINFSAKQAYELHHYKGHITTVKDYELGISNLRPSLDKSKLRGLNVSKPNIHFHHYATKESTILRSESITLKCCCKTSISSCGNCSNSTV